VFMERGAFETPRERRRRGGSPQMDDRWRDYLEWSFRENRPWNTMAREVLLARPATNETRGSMQFLYARKDNAQQMAEAVGSALLGLQTKCAQCHDHPLAPEVHQSHYWGMVAAFNRSKAVDTSAGAGVAESAMGGFIKFTNLKGGSSDALLRFLDDQTSVEVRPKDGEKENDSADKYVNGVALGEGKNLKEIPIPKISRREEFATWVRERPESMPGRLAPKINSFLVGKLSEEEFLALLERTEFSRIAIAEGYFFAGEKALLEGRKARAAELFQRCLKTGARTSQGYSTAEVELRSLPRSR